MLFTIAVAYVVIGYAVGVPLAAALDYVLYNENSSNHKCAIIVAIVIWPFAVAIALMALPFYIREHFHNKVDVRGRAVKLPKVSW